MTESNCTILVMASGSGSNFQALIDGATAGRIPGGRVARLVVNRAKAYATHRADRAGIPWEYFNLVSHGFLPGGGGGGKSPAPPEETRAARGRYDAALASKVLGYEPRPRLVVLAGWMHIFGDQFLHPIEAAGIRVINLHPALPGKYNGANAIERAYYDIKAGRVEGNRTGVMVHYVIREVDQGETIMVREVECREGDTLDDLTEKIHGCEHELLVDATALVVKDILSLEAE